jgi:hypothetical protein
MTLRTRLAALEARRNVTGMGSGVRNVPFVDGVPVAGAVEALGPGAFLIMPLPVDAETWEKQAVEQQRELAQRARSYLQGDHMPRH